MTTKEATIGALLDELVHVSMRREFYKHYGTHADGNDVKFDNEIKRVRRELKARIRAQLAEARHSDHLEHCECV